MTGFRGAFLALLAGCGAAALPGQGRALADRADSVFSLYDHSSPGCVAAVDSAGIPLLRRAWGMADLEQLTVNRVDGIFEAGSVSKQFTAAAVLLLDARGLLDLDDPVRRWFPEVPEYGIPITIRHLMLHSSGMRDWGAVAALAGWPRGSRVHTHADALDIIARQGELNHRPGGAFSYTNTGYNLMAMLVERASGMSLAEFTRQEFFGPLGMNRTSWRDDFTRIVPGRAVAYARRGDGWSLDMPFEQVHGNGGLLTTVDDLMIWQRALAEGRIGNPDISSRMKEPGRFADGAAMTYGGGLYLAPMRGVPAVFHTGATGGYRSILAAFPEQHIDVAILCNAGDAGTAAMAQGMLAGMVPFAAAAIPARTDAAVPPAGEPEPVESLLGTWSSSETGGTITFSMSGDTVLMARRRPGQDRPLRPAGTDRYAGPDGVTYRLVRDPGGRIVEVRAGISRATDVLYLRQQH